MKVTFERSGGFAGMVMTATVDTETLSSSDAEQLRQLMQAADFFHLPSKVAATPSQPDRFHYKITAEESRQHRTVHVDEAASKAMRPLLDWLTEKAKSQ